MIDSSLPSARPNTRTKPQRLLAVLGAWLLAAAGWAAEPGSDPMPRVKLETSLGDIVLELDRERAPVSVANFLSYVDADFYDGLIFHRVVPGFVIQGGGFDADMKRREPDAPIENESNNGLENRRGTVAMARLSDPDSASSQFYINIADNPSLDARPGRPGYTVFGRVVDGMDVAEEIERVETGSRRGMTDVPAEPIVIEHASRIE